MEIGWLQVFGCYSLFSWQSLLIFFFFNFWTNVLWARKQASKIPHTRWRSIVIDTFFFFFHHFLTVTGNGRQQLQQQ